MFHAFVATKYLQGVVLGRHAYDQIRYVSTRVLHGLHVPEHHQWGPIGCFLRLLLIRVALGALALNNEALANPLCPSTRGIGPTHIYVYAVI